MSKRPALVIAIAILSGLALVAPAHARAAYPYRLLEPATFGGPSSFLDLPAVPLTAHGILLGAADTTTPDSDYPKCPPPGGCYDSHIQHAFEWRSGRLIDLGALPGENSSAIYELNNRGVGAGFSENGLLDPYTGTAAGVAVMFKHEHVINLGTLPGGHESFAQDINGQGQVAGNSSNGTLDPFSIDGWGTQTRGFIWHNGVMKDLGTLGGPDATEYVLNEHGQITGWSYTNSTPNPATGLPTIDPFLWQNGHMRDLGTLGGTFGTTSWLNDHGQVVGNSDLAGDRTAHPFLWDGRRMLDLGTLGGDNGLANFVNESGDVVGGAQLPDGTFHAFLWRDGKMLDLPPVSGAPNAFANGVNAQDQVVGSARDTKFNELDAVLWRHGRGYDLNTLIAPSALHLTSAEDINNQGEIIGHGVLPNGDQRIFVLIPNYRALTLAGYAASAGRSRAGYFRLRHRQTSSAALLHGTCGSWDCALLHQRNASRFGIGSRSVRVRARYLDRAEDRESHNADLTTPRQPSARFLPRPRARMLLVTAPTEGDTVSTRARLSLALLARLVGLTWRPPRQANPSGRAANGIPRSRN